MRSKIAFLLLFMLALTSIGRIQSNIKAQDQSLQQKIGSLYVKPSGNLRLGVTDFLLRTGATDADVTTFNEVLLNDLKFAGVLDIVGKSLYPKKGLGTPAELDIKEWNAEPARLDYLAFGQVEGGTVKAYLYDVKAKNGLIEKAYSGGTTRVLAHQFADEILKKLFNIDGIATSKIAYTNSKEIMVMDYDGFGQRAVVRDGSYAILPNLSPDGSRLAYISYKSGKPTIEVHSSSDGLPYSFASFPRGTTSSPQFSGDGRIVFSSSKDSNAMEIYVASADGNRARRLTNNSDIIDTSPRWNPKTWKEIAFISDRSGSPQIYIMDDTGTNVRRVLNEGGQADSPAWSPDGQFIAYTWRPTGAGQSNIYVLDVTTGQILQITHGNGSNEAPTWAPDSRHVAFQSNRTGRWEVYVMNVDGTQQTQISKNGGKMPSWSR